jgi:opacity protein-like surface antigen
MKQLVLALLVPASLAFAGGPLSFGVKGGVPFTDAFDTAASGNVSYVTHNKHWTLGPELDVKLPFGLAVEIDALYRRVNYDLNGWTPTAATSIATTGNAWDFPVLLKWKLSPGPIRPYVAAGPTFRGVSGLKQVTTFFGAPSSSSGTRPAELQNRFNTGFTVAGGVEIARHISPEIRYTRWGWESFRSASGLLKSNPDQLEFLVGLTF